jgi:signal transduction histidine kinase
MKIRAKISLTFILLLIFGVTAVSSYAIMFIRNYLLSEGQQNLVSDASWLAITVQDIPADDQFRARLLVLQQVSGYEITVYDANGAAFFGPPEGFSADVDAVLNEELLLQVMASQIVLIDRKSNEALYVFAELSGAVSELKYIRVAQLKDKIYEPITTIRWIIYSGMFISIGVILLVSTVFSRYLATPILQLKESAQKIAEGKLSQVVISERSDEFNELAGSINQMARMLREDNQRLSEINEKQAQFFADITHEIRNPLHTIMASMELLQVGGLDPEKQSRYIQNARSQAERIGSLFKDLLTLQRYDSDENFIRQQWFDLQRITTRLNELYEDEAVRKGLELVIQRTSCRVLADEAKIEQVLDNLISNALKYTSAGKVRLGYEISDKKVTITVSDSGIGISEEHIPRLFDRFYRTDKARSRDQGGTGLGLAVVKSILDAHGSDISVESRAGSGTSFSFSLSAKS